ncbi:hypothetical protein TcasGA2_TC032213 [Tribolium castaneum]|uniref:Uncharacterized protein n=1 Tax=Tribolium castaneum TaxID=7070 RepID=A0A139WNH9_TRICA|nr:hypothetical protein TcasGA2_TC032213 [Tribolium castaneum]
MHAHRFKAAFSSTTPERADCFPDRCAMRTAIYSSSFSSTRDAFG